MAMTVIMRRILRQKNGAIACGQQMLTNVQAASFYSSASTVQKYFGHNEDMERKFVISPPNLTNLQGCACLRSLFGSTSIIHRRSLFMEATTEEVALQFLSGSEEGIAVLTLNRPHARNAIGQNFLAKLRSSIETLQFQNSARVLLICSTVSGVFCAGADLKERRKMDPAEASKFVQVLRSTFTALENLSIPTIAVVEGAALGGGLEMSLACDLRICGDEAVFGLPETGLGIIPGAGGTQRLPRVIGCARAKELIFTGRRIDGQMAQDIGLVNHCVQSGNAYQKALDIAQEIVKQGPLAIKLAKVAIGRGNEVDAASGMVIEEACYAQTLKSKDRLEGLAAFAEKRRPIYSGE